MNISRKPGIEMDRPEPSQQFLEARNMAGQVLQGQFQANGGALPEHTDYKWIKAELTYPSFDHLTFAYGNQVFSVLVELVDDGSSFLTQKECDRCLDESEKNNLVPCAFRVNATSMTPITDGWNLIDLRSEETVIPDQLISDDKIPMSEWELHNFAIQVVRQQIEGNKLGTILSFSDVIGIDPQIWFVDDQGKRNWVIVRHLKTIEEDEAQKWIGLEKSNPQLLPYDGYFAAVSAASSEPFLYDLDGEHIPLSERFSGKAPLYRGDGFHIKHDGLQRVYVTP